MCSLGNAFPPALIHFLALKHHLIEGNTWSWLEECCLLTLTTAAWGSHSPSGFLDKEMKEKLL